MQARRPVLCGSQVDRVWMQVILPEAGLDELDRMRVVRGEGAFEGLSQSLQALPYIEMFERKKYN